MLWPVYQEKNLDTIYFCRAASAYGSPSQGGLDVLRGKEGSRLAHRFHEDTPYRAYSVGWVAPSNPPFQGTVRTVVGCKGNPPYEGHSSNGGIGVVSRKRCTSTAFPWNDSYGDPSNLGPETHSGTTTI